MPDLSNLPIIRPNRGPQEACLSSPADIVIYGGARGGGKTTALLLECLRHVNHPQFRAVIFRKTYPLIRNPGGLWEESKKIYPRLEGTSQEGDLTWTFPSGARIKFAHLDHEDSKSNWQGAQITLICFDELTEFSESQFWFLLGSNRSTTGIRPYLRASCNPDAQSWVADLIPWWIDQETGYPIPERGGVIRWFARLDDVFKWADSPDELKKEWPGSIPKSLTFIPAKLEDNPALDQGDPDYRANLMALPFVEKERFLEGNWKVKPAAGIAFPRHKWQYADAAPSGLVLVRFYDKASSPGEHFGGSKPRTAGVLIGRHGAGIETRWFVVHGIAGRWGTDEREEIIRATAESDRETYGNVAIWMEREGGSAGIDSTKASIAGLSGFNVRAEYPTGKKHVRWQNFYRQVQAGNVTIVRGDWEWQDFIEELNELAGDEHLDRLKRKDYADAGSGAFNRLCKVRVARRTTPLLAEAVMEAEDEELNRQPINAAQDAFGQLGFMDD